MTREVKMSHLADVLEELSYPIERVEAARAFEDTTLLLADGELNLGRTIADTPSDRFDAREELEADLHNVFPRRAVGEPYQSEGEG